MPSTSGRAATYPRRVDKLKFFDELKELTDKRRAELGLCPRSELYSRESNGSGGSNDSTKSKSNS